MAILPLLTALLLTQSATDSLPFHRGQWAAQFAGGLNFASLGFLKFRSTKRALMVDIRVDGGHGEDLATDSTGTHFAGVGSHATLNIRFGWRHYHPAGHKVAAYHSLGLLAGFSHSVAVDPVFRSVSEWVERRCVRGHRRKLLAHSPVERGRDDHRRDPVHGRL